MVIIGDRRGNAATLGHSVGLAAQTDEGAVASHYAGGMDRVMSG